jgi:DNA repair protein RecN (Recombination protein N)
VIEELRIRGLGVIDEAVLELHPGLTAVTGETGAGKTMVLTGLGLVLGAKADAGAVRRGAPRAEADARWALGDAAPDSAARTRAAEAGADLDDGALLLGRTVSAEGRSRAFLGGRPVPASTLAEVGGELVAVHGQADQHHLASPARQRELLDRFGGPDLVAVRERYRSAYAALRAVEAEHAELTAAARERAREADLLRFGLDEIAAVAPEAGEEEVLARESDRLSHAESLLAAAHEARTSLAADGEDDRRDVLGLLALARRALEGARAHDPLLGAASDQLAAAASTVADVAADLASYEDSVEADPARQDAVEHRRAALAALLRKYGETSAAVVEWSRQAAQRLAALDGTDERIVVLEGERAALRSELEADAVALHRGRGEAAGRLGAAVTAELVHLAMPHAAVDVRVVPAASPQGWLTVPGPDGAGVRCEPGPSGVDDVEILLAPHPGAELRPVARGASGGELSRVMLALEVALAGADPVPTFVFDEVDAGIGGRAAVEVGRRLARLARTSQVVVVTHLPQVAAFADRHLVVRKSDDGSVTSSGVGEVAGDDRVRELTRMLAGLEASDSGAAHARELLDLAAAERADAPRAGRSVRNPAGRSSRRGARA